MNKFRTLTLASLILLLAVAIFALYAVNNLDRYLQLDTYKSQILDEIQNSLKRKVLYGRGEFSIRRGPAFSFYDVTVKEHDGSSDFLTSERIDLRLSLLHLLEKKIVITELNLKKPKILFIREKEGTFNISDLLEQKKSDFSLDPFDVWLSHATIHFLDRAASPKGVALRLEDAELILGKLVNGKKTEFKLTGLLNDGEGAESPVTFGGFLRLPAEEGKWTSLEMNAKLKASGLQPASFWTYYSDFVPFRKVGGRFDLDIAVKGKPTSFSSSGGLKIAGLRFEYPQVFHSVLVPKSVNVTYQLERTPSAVMVKSLDIKVDALKVKGSCSILDITSKDPQIVAKATTSTFRLEEFRGYIPYGIIIKDTADYIEEHIIGGTYRLDEGRLEGRVSEITHMGSGDNHKVLYIRGRVEQGVLTYGPKVPLFNSIKGTLEMKGKDFILHGMTAKFGASPFSLDGRITELYDPVPPCTYPFTMIMHPAKSEVAWIMGQSLGNKLSYSGESTLRLTGSGTTSGYSLTGDWDTTNTAYSFPGLISKHASHANTIKFQGHITKQEMRLDSLNFSLPPMSLSMSASYRYSGKPWLGVNIASNRFASQELAQLFPLADRYKVGGTLQASAQGESAAGDLEALSWRGAITMTEATFRPSDQVKPLTGINGTINFNGTRLESSNLAVRLGNSSIQGKGSLSNFSTPALQLTFSSPLLDPSDLGLHSPRKELRIARCAGSITLQDNSLQIAALSGQVNNTFLSLKGTIHDIKNPTIDIAITSPNLIWEDLLLLSALESEKQPASPPSSPLTLKATVAAERGKVRDIPFERLRSVIMLDNRILYLQPIEASIAGGRLNGTARIDLGRTGLDRRVQLGYRLENASAEQLALALDLKQQEIKGNLFLQGELTAKGDSAADIKRTALGSASIRIEDGSLRRFATLSKIFSILNVSQLLKLQLPDMVSGGMPFNKITGTFAIKDGIITTSDLYVASDAINISTVGSLNLVKDEIDATIGVKPLQTIDKVVSNIPIVGWILTGKDRTLLTAYFEAKGKVGDPQVTAVPVKGMAKGIFNIFRRIFELPAKLVTDTGEVIIGN